MSRAACLNTCDLGLAGKPLLASIYTDDWRAKFRRDILAMPADALPSYPMGYFLPMMHAMHPALYPADMQERVEQGLAVLWPQMSGTERDELATRLRDGDSMVACDELLAAAAFAEEFGSNAIKWPILARGLRRPEFFVEADNTRWAVECKTLQDNVKVRGLNATMMTTGQPWVASLDPNHDPNRMCWGLVKKIKRAQGGSAAVVLLFSQTPFLMPDGMEEEVRRILCRPSEVNLDAEHLPIAVACLTLTIVQGVWFCESACVRYRIEPATRDRIRVAIARGFVLPGNRNMCSEVGWADCE